MNKVAKLTQDLREATTKAAAGSGSMHEAMMGALGSVAQEMGKHLGSKFKESLKGFSKPFDAGHMSMSVSSEIKNAKDSGRPGDLGIVAKWDPRQGEYPIVGVWAVFPGAKQFSREIAFKLGESPTAVAKRVGSAFVRDLDTWMVSVNKAYE